MPQERLNSFRDLRVWQLAKSLAVAVYRATEDCPARERFGLAAQMRSAAVSVPANIAEGYGRNNRREYLQFLAISIGSLQELETHLLIAEELGLIADAAALPRGRRLCWPPPYSSSTKPSIRGSPVDRSSKGAGPDPRP